MARSLSCAIVILACVQTTAFGGAHTWDVNEVFSNADGTIQFIELREANGTPNEVNVGGRTVSSDATGFFFTIPSNVASPTSNRHILFATAAFAALPGAPTPDHVFLPGTVPFFAIGGDTVRYNPYDAFTFGTVPVDGINSMNDGGVIAVNSPTNYAGDTGSVDASSDPFGDTDGDGDVDLDDYVVFEACMAGPGVSATAPQTHDVAVGPGLVFSPADTTIANGDTVHWSWDGGFHNVESGVGGTHDGNFRSGDPTSSTTTTFDVTFDQSFLDAQPMAGDLYPYYCAVHFGSGMTGSITVAPSCAAVDADGDGDVDEADFAAFQRAFTGN